MAEVNDEIKLLLFTYTNCFRSASMASATKENRRKNTQTYKVSIIVHKTVSKKVLRLLMPHSSHLYFLLSYRAVVILVFRPLIRRTESRERDDGRARATKTQN